MTVEEAVTSFCRLNCIQWMRYITHRCGCVLVAESHMQSEIDLSESPCESKRDSEGASE